MKNYAAQSLEEEQKKKKRLLFEDSLNIYMQMPFNPLHLVEGQNDTNNYNPFLAKGDGKSPNYFPSSRQFSDAALRNTVYRGKPGTVGPAGLDNFPRQSYSRNASMGNTGNVLMMQYMVQPDGTMHGQVAVYQNGGNGTGIAELVGQLTQQMAMYNGNGLAANAQGNQSRVGNNYGRPAGHTPGYRGGLYNRHATAARYSAGPGSAYSGGKGGGASYSGGKSAGYSGGSGGGSGGGNSGGK